MKLRILWVLMAALSALTSFGQNRSYTIEANIKGLADGSRFFLRKNNIEGGTDTVHKIILKRGKFTVKGVVAEPELHFLFMEGHKEYLPLLLENERYIIKGNISAWPLLNVNGPRQHEEFEAMKAVLNKDLGEAKISSGEAKNQILKRYYEQTVPMVIEAHPNSIYTPFLIDKHLKIDFKGVSSDRKQALFDNLTIISQNGKHGRNLKKALTIQKRREAIKVGALIPDFKMLGAQGDTLSIRQLASHAEYTLLDLWASWCKPCRAEIPRLKEVYAKYHKAGFNIVGISGDKNHDAWHKAMAEDATAWEHGLEINGNVSELLDVSAIPGYVLIDRNGKLIAYSVTSGVSHFGPDIRGEALDKTLDSLLSKYLDSTDADKAWRQLVNIGKIDPKELQRKTSGEKFSLMEIRNRKFRETGLKFWNRFPNDRRRYIWFSNTSSLSWPVNYWKHPSNAAFVFDNYSSELDEEALRSWEAQYPKLLAEYEANYQAEKNELGQYVAEGERLNSYASILRSQLEHYYYLLYNEQYRLSTKASIADLHERFMNAAAVATQDKESDPEYAYSPWGLIKKRFDWQVIGNYTTIGLSIDDVKLLLDRCLKEGNFQMQEYALAKKSLLALQENPFSLRHAAMDGRLVDLEKMRGKVVLVDFWSTSCSSCIAMMPRLREVYEKYQKDGFEVVSVCTNPESDRSQIEKIKTKIGASWPILMIGGETKSNRDQSLYKEIWDRYAFRGVPQLLLLDREGKLIMYQGELHGKGLAKVIEKAVAKK